MRNLHKLKVRLMMIYRSKYNAKKTVADNICFDSKAESVRYLELKIMLKKGLIKDLVLQPKFLLQDKFKYNGKTIRRIEYVADFMYTTGSGELVVEDVKGVETKDFKIKMKLFLKKYGDKYTYKLIK